MRVWKLAEELKASLGDGILGSGFVLFVGWCSLFC
jgi:hypothetical protein